MVTGSGPADVILFFLAFFLGFIGFAVFWHLLFFGFVVFSVALVVAGFVYSRKTHEKALSDFAARHLLRKVEDDSFYGVSFEGEYMGRSIKCSESLLEKQVKLGEDILKASASLSSKSFLAVRMVPLSNKSGVNFEMSTFLDFRKGISDELKSIKGKIFGESRHPLLEKETELRLEAEGVRQTADVFTNDGEFVKGFFADQEFRKMALKELHSLNVTLLEYDDSSFYAVSARPRRTLNILKPEERVERLAKLLLAFCERMEEEARF